MPWFAWIAIVGIVVFGIAQVVSMMTGRPLPSGSEDREEVEELRRRLEELEQARPEKPEQPRIPTKAEENLAAEDRWRLDMMEARLENLEKHDRPEGPGDGATRGTDGGTAGPQDDDGARSRTRDDGTEEGADSGGHGPRPDSPG